MNLLSKTALMVLAALTLVTGACDTQQSSEGVDENFNRDLETLFEGGGTPIDHELFFDPVFSHQINKIEISTAAYRLHHDDISTRIADNEPIAFTSIGCGSDCYLNYVQQIDLSLGAAKAVKCEPTFFSNKIFLHTSEETRIMYLDYVGRQFKIGEQCYLLKYDYDLSINQFGLISWDKRR